MNTATPQGETPAHVPSVPVGPREVEVGIPGRGLTGDATPADRRDNGVSLADRRMTPEVVMSVYTLQRALVKARITLRALLRHATAGPRPDSDAIWRSVSLTARVGRLQVDVDRLLISTAHMIWRIEDAERPPSAGDRFQIAAAVDDSRVLIGELNVLTQHDLAAHYLRSAPAGVPYLEPILAP
jgi:hypothetical protein